MSWKMAAFRYTGSSRGVGLHATPGWSRGGVRTYALLLDDAVSAAAARRCWCNVSDVPVHCSVKRRWPRRYRKWREAADIAKCHHAQPPVWLAFSRLPSVTSQWRQCSGSGNIEEMLLSVKTAERPRRRHHVAHPNASSLSTLPTIHMQAPLWPAIVLAPHTSSSAVAERPRDALCPSVVSFNSVIAPAQFFLLLCPDRRERGNKRCFCPSVCPSRT